MKVMTKSLCSHPRTKLNCDTIFTKLLTPNVSFLCFAYLECGLWHSTIMNNNSIFHHKLKFVFDFFQTIFPCTWSWRVVWLEMTILLTFNTRILILYWKEESQNSESAFEYTYLNESIYLGSLSLRVTEVTTFMTCNCSFVYFIPAL